MRRPYFSTIVAAFLLAAAPGGSSADPVTNPLTPPAETATRSAAILSRAEMALLLDGADSAAVLFAQASNKPSLAPEATLGLARVALARGAADTARTLFAQADSLAPRSGYDSYGRAMLLLAGSGDELAADELLTQAMRVNPSSGPIAWDWALLGERIGGTDRELLRLNSVARRFPRHPLVNYRIACIHDLAGREEEAIGWYQKQLRVCPDHLPTLDRLGFLLLAHGDGNGGEELLERAAGLSGAARYRALAASGAGRVAERRFSAADSLFSAALKIMPDSVRRPYEDIRLIAPPADAFLLDSLDGPERGRFVRRFWAREDPTPATDLNERRLEHYRRVWYSTRHFSRERWPYDDRGRIYVRYGEPDNRFRSQHPDYERDRTSRTTRREFRSRVTALAQSESALLSRWGRWVMHTRDDPETPAWPVPRATLYEEWVYNTLGEGTILTFIDSLHTGIFVLASVPPGNPLQPMAPAVVAERVRQETPERYAYHRESAPLALPYYTACFRGERGRTDLEVYWGLGLADITFTGGSAEGYSAMVESGVAIFDSAWTPIERHAETRLLRTLMPPPYGPGVLHVERARMSMVGNSDVVFTVQTRDVATDRLQSYRERLHVDAFDSTALGMSGIVVAGEIREARRWDDERYVRRGFVILPMPSQAFRLLQPIHVYFEVYNLTRGGEYDLARYEIRHSVTSLTRPSGGFFRRIASMLGAREEEVAVSQVVETAQPSEPQRFVLATDDLPAGAYRLEITVRDMWTGSVVMRRRDFAICQ